MKAFPIFMEMNEGILGKLEFHAYIYIYIYIYDGKSCPTSVYKKKKEGENLSTF